VPRQPNREALDRLLRGEIDAVVFPASAAVTNLIKMLGDSTAPLRGVTIACVGPITAEVAARAGLPVAVAAEPATAAGVVRALREHWARAGAVAAGPVAVSGGGAC
jgi:uroporphyrinogen III methyltransferase/synthase